MSCLPEYQKKNKRHVLTPEERERGLRLANTPGYISPKKQIEEERRRRQEELEEEQMLADERGLERLIESYENEEPIAEIVHLLPIDEEPKPKKKRTSLFDF